MFILNNQEKNRKARQEWDREVVGTGINLKLMIKKMEKGTHKTNNSYED